jgi:DNA repair protein RAD16
MGKTIQILSLFVSDMRSPNLVVAYVRPNPPERLITYPSLDCSRPTVAVVQWKNELAAHTEGIDVLIWHGAGRKTNHKELEKHDVVGFSFDYPWNRI